MQRRDFLLGGLAALAAAPRILHARTDDRPRRLYLEHAHTGESLEIMFRKGSSYSRPGLVKLNHFLRDFRTDEVKPIDPRLFDLLYDLRQRTGNPDGVFEIVSAYRSPKTNESLRKANSGVARRSMHLEGKALDIRLKGSPISDLRDNAVALRRGGVGYYRSSNFVHVDTGKVRHW